MSDNYSMDKDTYIKQLEEEIVQLKKRIEELERLLGMNSSNSSKPPSSDPPEMSVILQKGRLWTFCCATAAFFMVHANRSQKAARKLMGGFAGKLVAVILTVFLRRR